MKLNNSIFWLGDEDSLRHVLDSAPLMQEYSATHELAQDAQADYEAGKHLISVQNDIALIKVHGSLSNRDSIWNQFFGITSYNEIRNAIVDTVQDEAIKSIVLDMDTPGGDAKGVNDLADFIKMADKQKPIETHISGSAFSAGYWIASATRRISGGKMSEAGSIGVISVIVNLAKKYKKEGYDIKVFRGGKYKALGNPFEEMTKTAEKIYQAKIDTMEGFFLDAVSENRGIPRSKVKSQVGEGLTFFAKEAVNNGLMDEVITFDELFGRLIKSGNSASAEKKILTEEIDMKKKVLTEEAVAAIAAGASEDDVKDLLAEEEVSEDASEDVGEQAAEEGKGDEAAASDEAGVVLAGGESSESEEASEQAVGETAEASGESSLVAFLKDEVKSLRAENADLQKKVSAGESALANEVALKGIADTFIASMCVPLGITPMNLKDMDTSVLLTQYTDIRAKFTENYKVGGVAEAQEGEPESSGEGVSYLQRAAAKANNI